MSRLRRSLPLLLLLLLLLGGAAVVATLALVPDSVPADAAVATRVSVEDDAPDAAAAAGGASAGREERRHVRVDGTDGSGTTPSGADAGAQGSGTAEEPVPAAPSPPVPPPPGDVRRVPGRVAVAGADGGLPGARVLVVRLDPAGGGSSWNGGHTGDDGSFAIEAPRGAGAVEVRIAARGYRPVVVPWTDGPVDVRLDPAPAAGTGRVLGLATDAAGRVLSGRLLLTTYDAGGDHLGLWVLADAGGNFVVEGIAAGWWRMALVEGGRRTDVIVPEGGETRVQLVGPETPWPGALSEEEYAARHTEISARMRLARTDTTTAGDPAVRTAHEMQDLESRWRGIAPAREVVVAVAGAAETPCVSARSTHGPNHRWRARVEDGRACFPALTFETWRLVAEHADGSESDLGAVAVVAGDGPLEVAPKSE